MRWRERRGQVPEEAPRRWCRQTKPRAGVQRGQPRRRRPQAGGGRGDGADGDGDSKAAMRPGAALPTQGRGCGRERARPVLSKRKGSPERNALAQESLKKEKKAGDIQQLPGEHLTVLSRCLWGWTEFPSVSSAVTGLLFCTLSRRVRGRGPTPSAELALGSPAGVPVQIRLPGAASRASLFTHGALCPPAAWLLPGTASMGESFPCGRWGRGSLEGGTEVPAGKAPFFCGFAFKLVGSKAGKDVVFCFSLSFSSSTNNSALIPAFQGQQ